MRDDHGVNSLRDQRFAYAQCRSYRVRIHTDHRVIESYSFVYVMQIKIERLQMLFGFVLFSYVLNRAVGKNTRIKGKGVVSLTFIMFSKWVLLSLLESTPPILYNVGLSWPSACVVSSQYPNVRSKQKTNFLRSRRAIFFFSICKSNNCRDNCHERARFLSADEMRSPLKCIAQTHVFNRVHFCHEIDPP